MKILIASLLLACIVVVYTQDISCTHGSDCGEWECCVDLGTKRSRVSRFLFSGSGHSVCHPKRYQGQTCHVFLQHEFGKPEIYMDYCPCDDGLVCQGDIDPVTGHHKNPKCIPSGEAASTPMPHPSPSLIP